MDLAQITKLKVWLFRNKFQGLEGETRGLLPFSQLGSRTRANLKKPFKSKFTLLQFF